MKSILLSASLLLSPFCIVGASTAHADTPANAPRIAVWDPQQGTTETRFRLVPAELNHIADELKLSGASVSRLTSAQIDAGGALTADRFDALLLTGDIFPLSNVDEIAAFTEAGGVLVAVGAHVPFLIAVEPEPDGRWTMAPKAPAFAWQRKDVQKLFGLKEFFKPELLDSGVVHEPSALLKTYLPAAPIIRKKLPSRWVYTDSDAFMYPLLGSKRVDGADVTPQMYIARKGKRTAIVLGDGYLAEDGTAWMPPRQLLGTVARLAADLKSGKVQPDAATRLVGLDQLKVLEPLQNRLAVGESVPEGATPVVRWGRFDGSSQELAASGDTTLTRSLAAGATTRLSLQNLKIPANQPLFLRVRGAFNLTGAGLKVAAESKEGTRTLWNERFNYIDASSAGNFNGGLAGFPTEFTRLIFVTPDEELRTLVVSNSGNQPIYFDAIQLEVRPKPNPDRIIGLGAGSATIKAETSRTWTSLRVNPRTQLLGPPGDPKRWDKVDANMAAAIAANPHIHVVLEGTPPWAAISPERLALGTKAFRPHTVPPDPQKFAVIVEEFVQRYGDKVDIYEIWNETDIQQFWRGTTAEYVELFNTIAPIIRRLDPSAIVMAAGMSGFKDGYVGEIVDAKIPQRSDLFPFHPYAGKSAGWDTVYGLVQGSLLSRGQNIEIFCDESGFVAFNSFWFQPPPIYTPAVQARLLDVAMARLLATDLAKLSVFAAGGDDSAYGVFDGKGQPLPAYSEVFATYLPLGQNGARRLDISMTGADGLPLQGVYAAASSHTDGSATVIVNPAEVDALQPPVDASTEFDNSSGWTTFFGKSLVQNGTVVVTPDEGKNYAGFYTKVALDTARLPQMELDVPSNTGGYDIVFKLADGRQIVAASKQGVGVWRGNLSEILPAGTKECEISLRVYGPTTFNHMRFSGANTPAPALPIRLIVPLTHNGAYTATAQSGGGGVPVKSSIKQRGTLRWAEVTLDLRARTMIQLKP